MAKPKIPSKAPAKPAAKAKPPAKVTAKPADAKPAAKAAPAVAGVPLKARTVWVMDLESAQFKAARRRDLEALKAGDADGMTHAEGLFIDKDVQKWWT